MIILPRNEVTQKTFIKDKWPHLIASKKAVIPDKVVNGLNLLWHSDLVVSGGGTMNREAAALGVPVFSIFRGRIGAVDRYLSEKGRLCLLTTKDEVRDRVKPLKRLKMRQAESRYSPALEAIITAITQLIESRGE
jgi:predicted glycosyltransferase